MPSRNTIIDPFRHIATGLVDYDNDEVWEYKPVDFQEFTESKHFCNLKWNGRTGCRPKIMEIGWNVVADNVREAVLLLGKGCLSGSERITCADGSLVKIEDLYEKFKQTKQPVELVSVDQKTNQTVKQFGIPKYSGEKQIYEVVLETGQKIRLTGNHNMPTYFGKKRIDKLKVGDHLQVVNDLSIIEGKRKISYEESRFLGYMIGDGYCDPEEKRHCFTNGNRDIVDDFIRCLRKIDPGCIPYIQTQEKYNRTNVFFSRKIHLCPNAKKLLKECKLVGVKAGDKFVPDIIFKCTKEIIGEFLCGLWMADGECNFFKNKNLKIYYSLVSKSKKLINDVQYLLIRLGFLATTFEKCKNIKFTQIKTGIKREYKNYKSYYIEFYQYEFQEIFERYVKLISYKRKNQLEGLRDKLKTSSTSKFKFVPEDISSDIRNRLLETGISKTKINQWTGLGKKMKRGVAQLATASLGDERNFVSGNIFYSTIKSITKTNMTEKVYDITIICGENERYRNYINCSVSTGNSGKDFLAALLHAYGIYKCLCMYNPQEYYELSPGSNIYFINIARNEYQAKNVFFTEFTQTMILRNAWMHGKHAPIASQRVNFIKGVVALSANSQAYSWLGYHTIQAVFDEMAFFIETQNKTEENTSKAKECWTAAEGSCMTRFAGAYKLIGITTPNSDDDFTMKKFYELKGRMQKEKPDAYCVQAASWDINPKTPKSLFADKLKYDRRRTMRDYGAVPVGIIESFWADPFFLQKHVTDVCKQCPIYQKRLLLDDRYACFNYKDCKANGYAGNGKYRDWFIGDPDIDYYMHVDLAKNKDRIGFTIAHVTGTKTMEITKLDKIDKAGGLYTDEMDAETEYEERPIMKVDAVGFIDTDLEENGRLLKQGEFYYDNFLKYIVYQLESRHIHLALVTFDQYQCLASGLVQTTCGIIDISEIKMGDRILTQYGYKKVLKTFEYENAPLLRITTKSGTEIECTPNHRLSTLIHKNSWSLQNREYEWTEAKDIEVGDYLHRFEQTENIDKKYIKANTNILKQHLHPKGRNLNDRVVSIEVIDNDIVYDLEVEEVHEYIVNGVVSHNSHHAKQSVEDNGIDTNLLSLDRVPAGDAPYPPDTVKLAITEGRVDYPYNMVLCSEAKNLKVINGKKVDHAMKESKDVWDSFAGAIWNAETNTTTGMEVGFIEF